jgi:DNA repair protein RadC
MKTSGSFFVSNPTKRKSITNSEAAYHHLKNHISYEQEEVWVICLNSLKHALCTRKVFIGTVDRSLVHPREVFFEVIKARSNSFILCHSHTSGSSEPSKSDFTVTAAFKKCAELLQIPMLDHVIFAENGFFSFLDQTDLFMG